MIITSCLLENVITQTKKRISLVSGMVNSKKNIPMRSLKNRKLPTQSMTKQASAPTSSTLMTDPTLSDNSPKNLQQTLPLGNNETQPHHQSSLSLILGDDMYTILHNHVQKLMSMSLDEFLTQYIVLQGIMIYMNKIAENPQEPFNNIMGVANIDQKTLAKTVTENIALIKNEITNNQAINAYHKAFAALNQHMHAILFHIIQRIITPQTIESDTCALLCERYINIVLNHDNNIEHFHNNVKETIQSLSKNNIRPIILSFNTNEGKALLSNFIIIKTLPLSLIETTPPHIQSHLMLMNEILDCMLVLNGVDPLLNFKRIEPSGNSSINLYKAGVAMIALGGIAYILGKYAQQNNFNVVDPNAGIMKKTFSYIANGMAKWSRGINSLFAWFKQEKAPSPTAFQEITIEHDTPTIAQGKKIELGKSKMNAIIDYAKQKIEKKARKEMDIGPITQQQANEIEKKQQDEIVNDLKSENIDLLKKNIAPGMQKVSQAFAPEVPIINPVLEFNRNLNTLAHNKTQAYLYGSGAYNSIITPFSPQKNNYWMDIWAEHTKNNNVT